MARRESQELSAPSREQEWVIMLESTVECDLAILPKKRSRLARIFGVVNFAVVVLLGAIQLRKVLKEPVATRYKRL